MPEILEVETYRSLAEATVGRRIVTVELIDPYYWRGEREPDALVGAVVVAVRRIGKLLLVDTDAATIGIRFGMTGRLLVDGDAAIDHLEYASRRDLQEWHRFQLRFASGELIVTDPRRLGWVELDPEESRLGPDASTLTPAQLRRALAGGRGSLKARLMDQARVAGLGNLLTDEILWRAGLDPRRPAGGLTDAEARRLHRWIRKVVQELGERGGSHTGDLHLHRVRGATCPRDATPLQRDTIGGRTTWWCPMHQR